MVAAESPAKKARVENGKPMVLHLGGSAVSEYYENLSIYYVGECVAAVVPHGTYTHRIALVHRDGTWSFPQDTSESSRAAAERLSLPQAMAVLQQLSPTVVVPHMYCFPGMTTYRALFDALKIALVGNDASVMALSTNKAQTRSVVASAGVKVPEAELLRKGDRPLMQPPFVLKPCNEDNSMGITLFTGKEGQSLDECLEEAFKFDSEILCERYIPLGRELRVAVVEQLDGSLEVLPCTEYFLTDEHPIRTSTDKYSQDSRGLPLALTTGGRKTPADVDEILRQKLANLAKLSHRALGCRDYSLFDVRVSPQGEPYFLEACLYCSFAPKSVIVSMAAGQKTSQQEVFETLINRAILRRSKSRSADAPQLLGMRAS